MMSTNVLLDTIDSTAILVARDDEQTQHRCDYAVLQRRDGRYVMRARSIRGGEWEMLMSGNVCDTAEACISGWASWCRADRLDMVHPLAVATVEQIVMQRREMEERERVARAEHEKAQAREEERRQQIDDAYLRAKPRFTRFAPRLYPTPSGVHIELKGVEYRGLVVGPRVPGDIRGGRYRCTHIASGKACGAYGTLADAKLAAWRFAQIGDWTRDEMAILSDGRALLSRYRALARDPYADWVGDVGVKRGTKR